MTDEQHAPPQQADLDERHAGRVRVANAGMRLPGRGLYARLASSTATSLAGAIAR